MELPPLEKFIAKANRENTWLREFLKSGSYEQFRGSVEKAIKSQAAWAAGFLHEVNWNTPDFKEQLNNQIYQHLPHMREFLDKDEVVAHFTLSFEAGAKAVYRRMGIVVKASFELTNQNYLAALKNQANYLLNLSTGIDDTTRDEMISVIMGAREENMTVDEVASLLTTKFDDIASWRAETIARTETSQAMSAGELATMKENGVPTKAWAIAGGHPVPDECDDNEGDGFIPVDESFSSGDDSPPAHPRCECYLEGGEIDLASIDIWDGS